MNVLIPQDKLSNVRVSLIYCCLLLLLMTKINGDQEYYIHIPRELNAKYLTVH